MKIRGIKFSSSREIFKNQVISLTTFEHPRFLPSRKLARLKRIRFRHTSSVHISSKHNQEEILSKRVGYLQGNWIEFTWQERVSSSVKPISQDFMIVWSVINMQFRD